MSENVIFCFSGSGNCLDIAKNIAAGLGDTDIVSLRRAPRVTDVRFCRRVGFVVPCHAGGLPLGVADFIRTLSVKPNPYTFGVVSCAAYPGTALADTSGQCGDNAAWVLDDEGILTVSGTGRWRIIPGNTAPAGIITGTVLPLW